MEKYINFHWQSEIPTHIKWNWKIIRPNLGIENHGPVLFEGSVCAFVCVCVYFCVKWSNTWTYVYIYIQYITLSSKCNNHIRFFQTRLMHKQASGAPFFFQTRIMGWIGSWPLFLVLIAKPLASWRSVFFQIRFAVELDLFGIMVTETKGMEWNLTQKQAHKYVPTKNFTVCIPCHIEADLCHKQRHWISILLTPVADVAVSWCFLPRCPIYGSSLEFQVCKKTHLVICMLNDHLMSSGWSSIHPWAVVGLPLYAVRAQTCIELIPSTNHRYHQDGTLQEICLYSTNPEAPPNSLKKSSLAQRVSALLLSWQIDQKQQLLASP